MSQKKSSSEPSNTFRGFVQGIKPLKQDKIQVCRPSSKQKKRQSDDQYKQQRASFEFSDQYQAHFSDTKAMQWVRPDDDPYLPKQLRRGDYSPELIIDLHGLTLQQAKLDLADAIQQAISQHIDCLQIIHGIGSGILKQQTPHLLVQHPAVRAFHQAPLEWGGQGALLVLLALS